MAKGKTIRVSDNFGEELKRITFNLNYYLMSQGERKTVYTTDVSEILAKNVLINITGEDLIKTGRKGKRILFKGEMQL